MTLINRPKAGLVIHSAGKRIDIEDASDIWFDGIEIHMQEHGKADIYIRPQYQVIMSMEVPYETRHPKTEEKKRVRRTKR